MDNQEVVQTEDDVPFPAMYTPGSIKSTATPFQTIRKDEQVKEAAAANVGFTEALGASFTSGNNFAVQILQDLNRRAVSGEADPTWKENRKQWLQDNSALIPHDQAWRYDLTNNKVEADLMLTDAQENQRKQSMLQLRAEAKPVSTFLATGLPSLIDVDLPLTIMSGGYSAAAKTAINATRFGRIAGAALSGGVTQAAIAEAGYVTNPNEDWTMVPLSGLMGAGLGGLVGSVGHANRVKGRVEEDFGENMVDGMPLSRNDYREPVQTDDVFEPDYVAMQRAEAQDEIAKAEGREPQAVDLATVQEFGSTAGARQIQGASQPVSSIRSTRIQDTIQKAKTWARSSGVPMEWFDNYSNIDNRLPGVGRAARRFQDFINASPISSDFARLMRSNSAVAQKLAYDLFENASGIIRNNKNGAGLHRMYQQQLHNTFKDYAPSMDAWMTEQHGANAWQRATNFKLQEDFNEAVISELQYRLHKTGQASTNKHILRAADSVDAWSAHEVTVRKGRPGEYHEKGADTLQPKSGYYHQQWLGQKFKKMVEGGKKWSDISDGITEVYMRMHPAMKRKDAKIWAQAVVDRARHQADGISMNIRSALDADGRSAVEDLLIRNGANKNEVDKLIDRLTGNMETAGMAGSLKRRVEIDMRMTTSNGIRMMDLIDTDVYGMLSRRSNKAAGAGALARKGIGSKQDWDDIVQAIVEEQNLTSIPKAGTTIGEKVEHFIDKDKHLTKADLDDLYSYFSGRPIEGAISPGLQRIIKLSNLALLGQLGLTQLAEFGPAIAAVGFKKFVKNLPDDLRASFGNATSPLAQELKHIGIMEPEEALFRYDQVYSLERATTEENAMFAKFDMLLNRGSRLQGFTSLMFQVRKVQHRMAVTTGTDRIMNTLRGVDAVSADRMRDLGFDSAISARIKQYVDNGTVEFQDGSVLRLNLNKWKPEDMDDFVVAINRYTDQQVQRAMIGESSAVFRKGGVASLFWHLKAFPMLALEKQTLRTLRLADDESTGMLMYSMAMAGLAYTVKQGINLNTGNLEPEKIMKGAFGLSNVTGWIPMWIDPVASMFGLPGINSYGREQGPIAIPAALSVMNDMLQLPGAVGALVNPFVEGTNSDVKTLQSIPIAGRMIGVTAILNLMKD